MLGVKGNSISDWENDKNRPHMDTIELIMGVLEVDANTLLGWNDPIQRKTDADIKIAEKLLKKL